MTIIPPYLKAGDTIGILCPSGAMPAHKADTCIEVLQQWGYQVKIGKTVTTQFNYFSASDEERLHELQAMLDDKNIKAILCARGGYGLSRIVDKLNLRQFQKRPKWIIGFSDITVLHAYILRKTNIACMHAPMAAAFNDGAHNNAYVQSLKNALEGTKTTYQCQPHAYNVCGKTKGMLVGGNLSLIAHQVGTASAFKTKNNILFLEDVGEYLYNVDRMFYQLKRSGHLDDLAGLVIGGFTDMKDTTIPFGKDVYAIIHEVLQPYRYPVCFQFPVSHEDENYALKVGLRYKLTVAADNVALKEI